MMMTLGIGLRGVPTGMTMIALTIVRVVAGTSTAGIGKFVTCPVMMLGSLGPGTGMVTAVRTSAGTRAEAPMTGAWITARLDAQREVKSLHHPRVKSRSKCVKCSNGRKRGIAFRQGRC
jgi:hypothetical protein